MSHEIPTNTDQSAMNHEKPFSSEAVVATLQEIHEQGDFSAALDWKVEQLDRTAEAALDGPFAHALADDGQRDWFRRGVVDIAAHGQLWGEAIPKVSYRTNFPMIILPESQKGTILSVYGRNPLLAEQLVSTEVVGGHFSSATTLLPVLEYGLKSLESQRLAQGDSQVIATGERVIAGEEVRNAISCVALDPQGMEGAALRYLQGDDNHDPDALFHRATKLRRIGKQLHPDDVRKAGYLQKAEETMDLIQFLDKAPTNQRMRIYQELIKENFPVAYFVDGAAAQDTRTYPLDSFEPRDEKAFRVPSDIGGGIEFAVRDGVDREHIPIIAVPSSRVGLVQELAQRTGWNGFVAALEDIPPLTDAAERWEERNAYQGRKLT